METDFHYIYISREYHNGKCLDVNTFGIGETFDPIVRFKTHNSSSKVSIQVRFEAILKVPVTLKDSDIHKDLLNLGFKNYIDQNNKKKKEIFFGTDHSNQNLTIEYIKKIIKRKCEYKEYCIENESLMHLLTTYEVHLEYPKLNYYLTCPQNIKIPKEIAKSSYFQYYKYLTNDLYKLESIKKELRTDYKILIKALIKKEITLEEIFSINNIFDFHKKLNDVEVKFEILLFALKNKYIEKLPYKKFTKENIDFIYEKLNNQTLNKNQLSNDLLYMINQKYHKPKTIEQNKINTYQKTHFNKKMFLVKTKTPQ